MLFGLDESVDGEVEGLLDGPDVTTVCGHGGREVVGDFEGYLEAVDQGEEVGKVVVEGTEVNASEVVGVVKYGALCCPAIS